MNAMVSSLALSAAPSIDADINERLLALMHAKFGRDVFDSWFGRLRFERIEGRRAILSVPVGFLRRWIDEHYAQPLLRVVQDCLSDIELVEVVVRSTARPAPAVPTLRADVPRTALSSPATVVERAGAPEQPVVDVTGSPVDPRYTLNAFHLGPGNQLAHAAVSRISAASWGDEPICNPLFIHGATGLGKTHLCQAIANAVADGRRVVYLTAEKFMYGFVLALKAQTSIAFRERLRGIDVFVVDDVQFIQGRSVVQEFSNAIAALLDARKQVVLAADRDPKDLELLDDRTRSRLLGGLSVEIGRLDHTVRTKLIEDRIAAAQRRAPEFRVSQDVIAHVAGLIQTNGRDLEGAVNRLLAYSSFGAVPLTIDAAETAVRDLIGRAEPKKIRIEDIQKLVATHFGCAKVDFLSNRRTANVVRPRQIAMYLSKVLTSRSLPEIGRRFGGRDHTTVLHAVRKIEKLNGSDHEVRETVSCLTMQLMG